MEHLKRVIICTAILLTAFFSLPIAAAESDKGASFTYELQEAGRVSAAVYDSDGVLVRTLLRGKQLDAGRHSVSWDGLGRYGEPQPPGDYTVRVLRTPGFRARYVTSLGISPGNAPYGPWVGNFAGPASIAVDDKTMYVATTSGETARNILRQSLDGSKRIWTRKEWLEPWKGPLAMAVADGYLYGLLQDGDLYRLDPASGAEKGAWDLLHPDGSRDDKARYGTGEPVYDFHLIDFAARNIPDAGAVRLVSYREHDEVMWLGEDGVVEDRVQIPDPRGVAIGPEGEAYVLSKDRLITITRDGEVGVVLKGLNDPERVAHDPANDHFLIIDGDRSERKFQRGGDRIKRFSRQGELLRTYGRAGGRRQGPYDPDDYRGAVDIEADGTGGFYVAEPHGAPRRVVHVARDGTILQQWLGGLTYYNWAQPEPDDPGRIWYNTGHGWLVLAELDYETGDWKVLETHNVASLADGLVSHPPGHSAHWRPLSHDGRTYLVTEGSPQVLVHRDGRLKPWLVSGKVGKGLKERVEDVPSRRFFQWRDENGDGRPQSKEFTFSNKRLRSSWVDEDFDLLTQRAYRTEAGTTIVDVVRNPARWRESLPDWGIEAANVIAQVDALRGACATNGRGGNIAYQDAEGNIYAGYSTRRDELGDVHGDKWPTRWTGSTRLVKWDVEGNYEWSVGRGAIHGGLADPGVTPPGEIHVPISVIGETDKGIVLADKVENPAMVWTRDGLYAGQFFDRRADDGLPEIVYHWWKVPGGDYAITTSDNTAGGRVITTPDGRVFWFAQGRNSVPVYQITGWEDWTRLSGTMALSDTPPHARAEGNGLSAAYYDNPRLEGELALRTTDRRIAFSMQGGGVIDSGWGPMHDFSIEQKTDFSVRWTGWIEPHLSEQFVFSVYARGGVRFWVDGKLLVDEWKQKEGRYEAEPLAMTAGERVSVRLEYRTSSDKPACSLNWDSFSRDRERIPPRYLYPRPK